MPILTVDHVTTYDYSRPVGLGEHRMMLRPRDSYDQRLLSAALEIDPEPERLTWIHDVFDNCVAIATFAGQTRRLRIASAITLDHSPLDGPEFLLEERARYFRSPTRRRNRLISPARSSASIPITPANSIAGCAASSIRAGRPRPANC